MSDFKAKMHQIRFRLGLRPRPRWGRLQRSPGPLAGFKGPTSREDRGRKGRGGEGIGGKGMGREERKGEGGRIRTPFRIGLVTGLEYIRHFSVGYLNLSYF